MSDLVLEGSETLYIGQIDIVNAFYALELPEPLRKYFCLAPISPRELDGSLSGVRSKVVDRVLYPRLKVVPMGWSHALVWCQQMHEDVVNSAGLPPARRLADKVAALSLTAKLGPIHLQYVDKFAALGCDIGDVRASVHVVKREMESKGLPVHEEEFGSSHSQLLGWVIDGLHGCVEPTPKRFWRVRSALTEVLEA